MRFIISLLLIFIGILLTFLLFFPVHIKKNKIIEIQNFNELARIYQEIVKDKNFFYYFKNESTDKKFCLIIIANPSLFNEFSKLHSCIIFTSFPRSKLDISLEFLSSIINFLEKNYKIGIITKGNYNLFNFYLAQQFKNLNFIIFIDPFYEETPLIWKIFAPRICYIFQSDEFCSRILMQDQLLKEIYLKKIKVPISLLLREKEILNFRHSGKIQKNIEIFHQIPEKQKKILLYSKKNLEKEIKSFILNLRS